MSGRVGIPFQKFAEPWMAEQKRHKDVPQERFLERYTHLTASTTVQICEKTQPTAAPAPKS